MELITVESSKIEARRLYLQDGKGFQDKRSGYRTVTGPLDNALSNTPEGPTGRILKEINCNLDFFLKHPKSKRPDIKVYEPKVNLYASRVNKKPGAVLNDLLEREKESGMLLKETNSCNCSHGLSQLAGTKSNVSRKDKVLSEEVSVYLSPDTVCLANQTLLQDNFPRQVVGVDAVKVSESSGKHSTEVSDFPPQHSKSWADQVEEYLSSSTFPEGEAIDNSSISDCELDPVTVSGNGSTRYTEISDSPPQKSKSWADQVEEYLSSSALLEEDGAVDNDSLYDYVEDPLKISGNSRMYSTEVSDYSSQNSEFQADQVEEHLSSSVLLEREEADDKSTMGLQSNSLKDVGHQDVGFSSGYSSSSEGNDNLILEKMDQKNYDEEFFNSFQRHTPWDPDYNPRVPSESDILRFVKARNAIVERQIAFFDKLVVDDGSSKGDTIKRLTIPKKSESRAVSARTQTFQRPCTPAVINPPEIKETKSHVSSNASLKNSDDESKLLTSPKQIVEKQAACFDETAFFIHPPVPKTFPIPTKSRVSSASLRNNDENKLLTTHKQIDDHQYPECFDETAFFIHPPVPKKVPIPTPTFQVPSPSVGYNDVNIKQFLVGHNQVDWSMPKFHHMDIPKVSARYISRDIPDLILPLYVPCTKIDHRFCASNCWSSRDSTYLDDASYIPPPRPLAKKV